MLAPDGKNRLTDVADMSQLFRLIQSIPSKKAEPFKRWMAEVAEKRIDQSTEGTGERLILKDGLTSKGCQPIIISINKNVPLSQARRCFCSFFLSK